MVKVFITGVLGYIGSCLAKRLIQEGHDVVGIDNEEWKIIDKVEGITYYKADIRDKNIDKLLQGADIVIHLAAISYVEICEEKPNLAFDINVNGTINIAWRCAKNKIPLIFPCSMAIYGNPVKNLIKEDHPYNPTNMYGRTKYLGLKYIQEISKQFDLPTIIFIKSNVYGTYKVDNKNIFKKTVINIFTKKAKDNETIKIFKPGTQEREFLHIKDAVNAYMLAIKALINKKVNFDILNIGSEKPYSVLEIANLIKEIGKSKKLKVNIELVDNPRKDESLRSNFNVSCERAKKIIGFEAKEDIRNVIREMI